ncbi:MAG TPA: GAF domain-containing sensor histidine kinase [Acidimicrobiia bacterium]|nr:GAF domain-containing sensor histidine kinase [Acidimicrobiia bacterium]
MTATIHRATNEPTPRELELLLDVTRRLAAGDRIEAILQLVATDFRSLLRFDRIEYAEPGEGDGVLVVRWVEAFGGPVALEPGTVCVYESSNQERKPYLIFDIPAQAQAREAEHPLHRLAEAGYQASISCPLVDEGNVTGVIFFNTREPNVWNLRHVALVELIAGHLGIAATRARLTAALRASNADLVAAQASRTEFIAAVSHEIRTPLTAIVGLTHALHEQIDVLSVEEIRDFAGVVNRQAREVTELVEDLLVATRAEAGSLRINPVPTAVGALVAEVVESVSDVVSPRVTGTESTAAVDPLRLRQILRNLLTNAARHGGPDVTVDYRAEGGSILIEVADDGIGVPADRERSLFQAFVIDDESHAESVGLGLAVSLSLAEAMGGALTYERRDGRTVMAVRVPSA